MSDIAAFLRARYAERRKLALAASPTEGFALSGRQSRATIGHIAANDPTYVLADLDAKLAIVDEHKAREVTSFDADGQERTGGMCETCLAGDDWPCRTLRLLAQPFAGHPDHKGEEWDL